MNLNIQKEFSKSLPLFHKRDIQNFIVKRLGTQNDDTEVGSLLVRTFLVTYSQKMPEINADQNRVLELLDAKSRREHGFQMCLEIGRKIIATGNLVKPKTLASQSWVADFSNLRCVAVDQDYSGLGLADNIVAWAIALTKEHDYKGICLHVYQGAEKVAKLYEKHGFVRDHNGDCFAAGNSLIGYSLYL